MSNSQMPAAASKPTVILVPGGWHVPHHCHTLIKVLQRKGYRAFAVHHATTRNNAPWPNSYHYDEAIVTSALLAESNEGHDILLLMHSYGGFPGSAACRGLLKEQRKLNGEKGGVIGTVYMASFAMNEGQCIADLGSQEWDWFTTDVSLSDMKYSWSC
jgi:hypothetical protein